jgi:hypothetical protein
MKAFIFNSIEVEQVKQWKCYTITRRNYQTIHSLRVEIPLLVRLFYHLFS